MEVLSERKDCVLDLMLWIRFGSHDPKIFFLFGGKITGKILVSHSSCWFFTSRVVIVHRGIDEIKKKKKITGIHGLWYFEPK